MSEGLELLSGQCPAWGGGGWWEGVRGGRADLLLYSLPVRGLGVRNSFSFVQALPIPLVPPPVPLSVTAGALSWLREARAEGTGGREAGGR